MNKELGEHIQRQVVDGLGMPLDRWIYRNCIAHFGTGLAWATLYDIKTEPGFENQGMATHLLTIAKHYYERRGMEFGGTVALSPAMAHLYNKLGIKEYK